MGPVITKDSVKSLVKTGKSTEFKASKIYKPNIKDPKNCVDL